MLCTTNIVFGMENQTTNWANVISNKTDQSRILVKETNGLWSTIGITGDKAKTLFNPATSIKTNKNPGVIFFPQTKNRLTLSCSLEIPIPDLVSPKPVTTPTICESTIQLYYGQINAIRELSKIEKNEIYIEYPHNKTSYLVQITPGEKKNNQSPLKIAPKSQDNALPSAATKENPIFHIVLQDMFYTVNSNFDLEEDLYYLTGHPCKEPLLLDPSQAISSPIIHDGVLIPLSILQTLQQELIKQDTVDLYVDEGNDEIKRITIKQPVNQPIQQPALEPFFAAHPFLKSFLIFGGISCLTLLAACFMTPGLGTKLLERIISMHLFTNKK